MARRCFVCGFESPESVCPRCNTVRRFERAACPQCGKAFDGWIATCDACGSAVGARPPGPVDPEAVRTLASVPGISPERAQDLAAKGFRDFADVVRLALPESAIQQGLHQTIARHVEIADLVPRPLRSLNGGRCLVCGAASTPNMTRCPACGSSFQGATDPAVDEDSREEETGEIADLAADEDFQSMPAEVRSEFLEAFVDASSDDALREECRHQIETWRTKGFDVAPLERLVEEDPINFGEKSARIIRAQMLKKVEAGRYQCPLCDVSLESTAEECSNCGARFS